MATTVTLTSTAVGKKVLTPDGFGEKLITAFTAPFTDADYISVSALQFTAAAYFVAGGFVGAMWGRKRAEAGIPKNFVGI